MSENRRRAAGPPPPTRTVTGPKAALVAAAGLAVLAVVVQVVGGSGAGSLEPIVDEVRTAELPCPAPVLTGEGTSNSVTMVAPPGAPTAAAQDGEVRGSAAVVEDLKPAANSAPRAKLDKPGRKTVGAGSGEVLVRGSNELAPGLAAELISTGRSGTARGLEAVTCATAGPTAWFVGVSTAAGRRDRLVLTNPEAIPAVIDLRFWDESGPVAAPPNSTGIDVPASGVVSIPLDGMAAGHQRLGLAVTATSGRVSAVVHDIDEQGIKPRGVDWIAPAQTPSRTVVIPGLPDGKLGRTLQLLAPGDTDAVVKLRLLTPDNSFAPAGLEDVDLKAGQVAEFDLSKATESTASALVVTSDRPVVAAVRLTKTVKGNSELAFATAAPALTAPAAIPTGSKSGGPLARLILAAPRGDATVTMSLLGDDGTPGEPKVITIPMGRAVVVDPSPIPKGSTGALNPHAILLTPGPDSGPVHVARVLTGGSAGSTADFTVTSVVPGRYTVSIPGIEPDLTAVIP